MLDNTLIDETLETLNELLQSGLHCEHNFRASAEMAVADDLRALLRRRAEECKAAVAELSAHVQRLGGDPVRYLGGTDNRLEGWLSSRGTLPGYTDLTLLQECERGEDDALERYADVLDKALEPAAKAMVENQRLSIKRSHDQIRAMRDRLQALR